MDHAQITTTQRYLHTSPMPTPRTSRHSIGSAVLAAARHRSHPPESDRLGSARAGSGSAWSWLRRWRPGTTR